MRGGKEGRHELLRACQRPPLCGLPCGAGGCVGWVHIWLEGAKGRSSPSIDATRLTLSYCPVSSRRQLEEYCAWVCMQTATRLTPQGLLEQVFGSSWLELLGHSADANMHGILAGKQNEKEPL